MINDTLVTVTMRKSLVTCHALWVTSSLTLVCTVQSSSLTLCKVQSRVWDKDGPGEIYCPDICPYNSCPAVQYFPYNTSTMASATLQCSGGKIMCLVPTTYNTTCRLSPYLDRIWRGTNWKSPKYAHVPMLPLTSRSNQCDTIPMPFPVKEMPFTIKPLGSVSAHR